MSDSPLHPRGRGDDPEDMDFAIPARYKVTPELVADAMIARMMALGGSGVLEAGDLDRLLGPVEDGKAGPFSNPA